MAERILRKRLDRMNRSTLLFCGHHKGGTVWASRVMVSACHAVGLRGAYVASPKQFDFDLSGYCNKRKLDFLCYTNADLKYVRQLNAYRGFHVIRDPRDVIVSGYYSHMNSHPTRDWPELIPHRETLKKLPKEEGLLCEMQFSSRLPTDGVELHPFRSIREWDYESDAMLEFKFEHLIESPFEHFCRIFDFLGLLQSDAAPEPAKVSRSALRGIVDANGFSKQAGGRPRGDENVNNHYRKGVAGDWKNHFGERLKQQCKDAFGELLLRTGYERGTDW